MRILKTAEQIELMRASGKIVAEAHQLTREMLAPGVETREIDEAIEALFLKAGATPLFKGVPGPVPFPAATCISVNDQVVHGIPGSLVLKEGDLVSVDTGCRWNGWCSDSAWTYSVGKIDDEKQRLLQVGEESLNLALSLLNQVSDWSEIAKRMQNLIRQAGFSVVESFVGHGIGQEMHEDPQVPNFCGGRFRHEDFTLEPGLVLAIEPMVNAGTKHVNVSKDDFWTVSTRDGRPSVHFEHTVALTEQGPVILTAPI